MFKLSKFVDFKKSTPVNQQADSFIMPFFDNLFRNFYRSLPLQSDDSCSIIPYMDFIEDDKHFKIEAEMPGVDEKDITVKIKDGILVISADKVISKKDEGKNYIMREIDYGSYQRSISLPENADYENAQSTFKKGMLWVDIPKKSVTPSYVKELEIKTM